MKNPDEIEIRAYYNKLLDQCSLEMRMLPWITRFLDRVYFGQLLDKIDQSTSRYMSGTFGKTELYETSSIIGTSIKCAILTRLVCIHLSGIFNEDNIVYW